MITEYLHLHFNKMFHSKMSQSINILVTRLRFLPRYPRSHSAQQQSWGERVNIEIIFRDLLKVFKSKVCR